MFEIGFVEPTRELLLEHNSEEVYMSYYLGVSITKELFCSPLREDNNPTCAFFRSNVSKKLLFKDFGSGFVGDFVNVVMEKYKVSYYLALKIIANDFDIVPDSSLKKNVLKTINNHQQIEIKERTKIQVTVAPFTEIDLKWWKQFGITENTLKYYNVFRIEYVFLNGHLTNSYKVNDPIYGYYFGKDSDGIELWKIYFPLRKKFRFLLNCSEIQGMRQLPEQGDYLVITKSLKDVMSLYELGIAAIAPQAESMILNAEVIEFLRLKFNHIIFNGDWDTAGKLFMIKNRKIHGGICLSFKNKQKYGKDISDFIKLFGIEQAKRLIKEIKSKCKLY